MNLAETAKLIAIEVLKTLHTDAEIAMGLLAEIALFQAEVYASVSVLRHPNEDGVWDSVQTQLVKCGLVVVNGNEPSLTREGLRVLAGLRPLALTTPALQEDALRRVRQELQTAADLASRLTAGGFHTQIQESIQAALDAANWTHEDWRLPDPPKATPVEAVTGC